MLQAADLTIRLNPADDVVIACRDLEPGTNLLKEGVICKERIGVEVFDREAQAAEKAPGEPENGWRAHRVRTLDPHRLVGRRGAELSVEVGEGCVVVVGHVAHDE